LPKVDQPTAAKALSISERALRHARRVQDHGEPELIRAVERGHLAVSVAERATRLSGDVQRRIAAEAEAGHANVARTVVKKEARTARESALADEQFALPSKKYGVILADPEWRFEPYSRDTGMDRSADNHYSTAATAVIAARPVADIAADDCALFLWATVPMLPDALAVMAAWGFAYKSHVIWNKDRIGTGYWFRNKHELILVGTRGNIPAPAMGEQWPSVTDAPVGRHSAKPEIFLEMIEGYFPNLPKIELNRRGPARKGWDAWGNESEGEEFDPKTGEITDALLPGLDHRDADDAAGDRNDRVDDPAAVPGKIPQAHDEIGGLRANNGDEPEIQNASEAGGSAAEDSAARISAQVLPGRAATADLEHVGAPSPVQPGLLARAASETVAAGNTAALSAEIEDIPDFLRVANRHLPFSAAHE
jgi:N6-adenosine-specific RNA methylase IME4